MAKQSKYRTHLEKWKGCTLCTLCESRTKMVFVRGKLPCDVLFIGEGPGQSEDVIGAPFVGPAGRLLDGMIERAEPGEARLAFTNLVCCMPKKGQGVREPSKSEIKACGDRLREIYDIASPKLIVWVGKLAEAQGPKMLLGTPLFDKQADSMAIVHPSWILKAQEPHKSLGIERTIVQLSDAFEELLEKIDA